MKQMRKEQTLTLLLHGIHTRLSYQKLPKSNRQNKRLTVLTGYFRVQRKKQTNNIGGEMPKC